MAAVHAPHSTHTPTPSPTENGGRPAPSSSGGGGGDPSSSDVKQALDTIVVQIGQQILQSGRQAFSDFKDDMDDGS